MIVSSEPYSQREVPSRGSPAVRIDFGDQVIQIFPFPPTTENAHDGMTYILSLLMGGIQRFKAL